MRRAPWSFVSGWIVSPSGWLAAATVLATCTLIALPPRARACGGCFHPPPSVDASGAATVVTAHRMAMAISPTQSTLWDQFAYSGDAEDFVWVLPASPEATVELADNRFFALLEARTDVLLTGRYAPLRTTCPTVGCTSSGTASGSFRAADSSAFDIGTPSPGAPPPPPPPVMVHNEGTVGPYETATVSSDDPMALVEWLQERGYSVPDSILPTIRYYGEMGLAFVALRLSPGEGIQRMQPVRVSFPGLSYVLPLRMIAAGIADKVGLRLFVFGESRYEAQNFPNAVVDPAEVAYDWDTASFTYDALFQQALASSRGRTWVTTYSRETPIGLGELRAIDDDLRIALVAGSQTTVTRLEASLGVAALDRDLVLSYPSGQSSVSNVFSVTREINRPPDVVCPPPPPCDDTETLCAGAPRSSSGPTGGAGLAGLLAALALAFIRRAVSRARAR